MNIFASAGVAVGLFVGIVLCVILFKFANRDNKVKTEYDERQKAIRGRAYRYAFYSILGYEVLRLMLDIGEISLPVDVYILDIGAIVVGCLVLCVYCIWHDVYWGLNNNPQRYVVVFCIALVINAIPVVFGVMRGEMIEDGRLGIPFVNLMVIVMFLVIGVELLIKRSMNNNESED